MSNQTGPRTGQGKQASSQNNRQHGLSTSNLIVPPAERPIFDQMESELRDEIQPDGPLEHHAFRRFVTATWQLERCHQQEAALLSLHPSPETDAAREKIHRYYQRWEGSCNSAFRQLRLLQTDRGCIACASGASPITFGPLADLPKIEHFARRIARRCTFNTPALSTPPGNPAALGEPSAQCPQPDLPANPITPLTSTESTLCETKSPRPKVGPDCRRLSEVGRNSPCPCGSGRKFKRCCGVDAPPILHRAA